jgi:SAM-dependent methyltransferase
MLKKLAARFRTLNRPVGQARLPQPRAAILDQYVRAAPAPQHALDIFKGEWWSCLPGEWSELEAGQLPLFDDSRIHWAIEALDGVSGKQVLELGPLEGGHTYSLERAGAQSILAIEASTKAFLKCLVVKELMGLERSRFVLGDFEEYLRSGSERFDAAIASGVLYHVRQPVELIQNLARVADHVFIWT